MNAGYDLKRSQVTAAFKKLQGLGLGTFVTGRKGWESRFVFAERVTVIARLLAGEEIDVIEHELEEEDAQVFPESIEHLFNLRPDFTLSVELPSDLSEFIQRLAQFFGCHVHAGLDEMNTVGCRISGTPVGHYLRFRTVIRAGKTCSKRMRSCSGVSKMALPLNQDLGPVIDIDDSAFQQPNLMAVVDSLEGRDAEAMLTQRVADMLCKHLIAP